MTAASSTEIFSAGSPYRTGLRCNVGRVGVWWGGQREAGPFCHLSLPEQVRSSRSPQVSGNSFLSRQEAKPCFPGAAWLRAGSRGPQHWTPRGWGLFSAVGPGRLMARVLAVKPRGTTWPGCPSGRPGASPQPHGRGAGGLAHFTAPCGPGLPQQPGGRGTGCCERGSGAGAAPTAGGDGCSPPPASGTLLPQRRRRGGQRAPLPTAAAQAKRPRVSPRRAGGGKGSGHPLQALRPSGGEAARLPRGNAEARPLPVPSPAGAPYLKGLAPYGTAPTRPGDAPASATAPPCCTAEGLRAQPGPLRGGRVAPERRAATSGG